MVDLNGDCRQTAWSERGFSDYRQVTNKGKCSRQDDPGRHCLEVGPEVRMVVALMSFIAPSGGVSGSVPGERMAQLAPVAIW